MVKKQNKKQKEKELDELYQLYVNNPPPPDLNGFKVAISQDAKNFVDANRYQYLDIAAKGTRLDRDKYVNLKVKIKTNEQV